VNRFAFRIESDRAILFSSQWHIPHGKLLSRTATFNNSLL
jgi:hypothetical protein